MLSRNAGGLPGQIKLDAHEFVKPKKEVTNINLMNDWKNSEAYHEYFGFIKAMNIAVKGKPLNYQASKTESTLKILNLISTLNDYVTETPPIDQPQRFGNKAFRSWYEKVKMNAESLLVANLSEEFSAAAPEMAIYLTESFGNEIRIDYGTGHEMAFCMFLYCLFKIGVFSAADSVPLVNVVFHKYLELVRRLQTTYRMEPAGSHGAWSLDDYQFVPFIWGSSQLINSAVEPNMFVQEGVVNKYSSEYMFMGCIKYIMTVKTGNFFEHSNQLWNISGLPSWTKVNQGLLKMYEGEENVTFKVHEVEWNFYCISRSEKFTITAPKSRTNNAANYNKSVFACVGKISAEQQGSKFSVEDSSLAMDLVTKQRATIEFCQKLGLNSTTTQTLLRRAYGSNAMSRPAVFKWFKMFRSGRVSVANNPKSGRPKSSCNDRNEEKIRKLLEQDSTIPLRELASRLGISVGSCHRIIREKLNMRYVIDRYVLFEEGHDNQDEDTVTATDIGLEFIDPSQTSAENEASDEEKKVLADPFNTVFRTSQSNPDAKEEISVKAEPIEVVENQTFPKEDTKRTVFEDPVDTFYHEIAQRVKRLKPDSQSKAQLNTENIISQLEKQEVDEGITSTFFVEVGKPKVEVEEEIES